MEFSRGNLEGFGDNPSIATFNSGPHIYIIAAFSSDSFFQSVCFYNGYVSVKCPFHRTRTLCLSKIQGTVKKTGWRPYEWKKDRTKPRNASILGIPVFHAVFTVLAAVLPLPQSKNLDYLILEAVKRALPSHLSFSLSLFHFRPHSQGDFRDY